MVVFKRFERMSLPVIAAVQGLCFGGGLELAPRADVLFTASNATFGLPGRCRLRPWSASESSTAWSTMPR